MSESRGLFFTLMLENAVSSGGPEGNIMIDLYEVGSDGGRHPSHVFMLFLCAEPIEITGLGLQPVQFVGRVHFSLVLKAA